MMLITVVVFFLAFFTKGTWKLGQIMPQHLIKVKSPFVVITVTDKTLWHYFDAMIS